MKHLFIISTIILFITFLLSSCGQQKETEFLEYPHDRGGNSSSSISKEEINSENGIQTILAFFPVENKFEMASPFFISVRLPYGWNVKEGKNKDEKSPLKDLYFFYDEEERQIGKAGFRSFSSALSKQKEDIRAIYYNLVFDTSSHVDFMSSYQAVNNTYEGSTGIADIVYYHLRQAEKKMVNNGILAYNRTYSAVILFEFDARYVSKEKTEEIAKSLMFQ